MSPKTIAHMFDYSELAAEMAKIDDGGGDIRAIIREDMGKFHAEVQSKMVVMPLEHYDSASYGDIERNYTSLMKIVSNNAELTEMSTAGVGSALIASANAGATPDQIGQIY